MFQCVKCGVEQCLDSFYTDKSADRGHRNKCKSCCNQEVSERMDNMREFLRSYKMKHGCADCGYNKHWVALDFDHLPEHDKRFNIAHRLTAKMETMLEEIAKCEVVCANCHRIRTQGRLDV